MINKIVVAIAMNKLFAFKLISHRDQLHHLPSQSDKSYLS